MLEFIRENWVLIIVWLASIAGVFVMSESTERFVRWMSLLFVSMVIGFLLGFLRKR